MFGSEARIVVVLYRKEWGETSWTKIEETAIKNRGFDEKDYSFCLFIRLNNLTNPLEWLPRTHIWLNLDECGIDGIVNAIKSKIQNAVAIGTSSRALNSGCNGIYGYSGAEIRDESIIQIQPGRKKALRYIKRVLDGIEELRNMNPEGFEVFKTHASKLASHISWSDFKMILNKITSMGIAKFDIRETGHTWGSYAATITVLDWFKFDKYYNEVQRELITSLPPDLEEI